MNDEILVTGKSLVPEATRHWLLDEGYSVRFLNQDYFTSDELHEALEGVAGYLIGGFEEALPEHFERASSLRAVGWVGTDFEAYVPGWRRAVDLGIGFVNAPHTNAHSVAEYTVMLMLIGLRKMGIRFATAGAESPFAGPGEELRGRTIGIIGLGHVGGEVARCLSLGFGGHVVYWSRTRNPAMEAALGLSWCPLDEVLQASDIVTLHRPGPEADQRALIGDREFSLMRPGSILINTVKANLVDPDSLYRALNTQQVGFVGFDCPGVGPEWERIEQSFGWDRFVSFEQNAFNTTESNLRTAQLAAEAVVACLEGQEPEQLINPTYSRRGNAD